MTTTRPPADLGSNGRKLWSAILHDHGIRGAGNLAVLHEAAKAIDAAEEFGSIIARDGPVLQTKSGVKDHPLIRHQLAARALACRLLSRLGVVDVPKRRVGRPGYGGIGVTYEQLADYRDGG
jgi:hypothetical protein